MTERSIEYDLGRRQTQHVNRDTDEGIRAVLRRLPEDVREFVLDTVWFASAGHDSPGHTIHSAELEPLAGRHLILLAEDLPPDDDESIVAHEIAHAFLGHGANLPDAHTNYAWEVAAVNLTASWGFTGLGADPAYAASHKW